MFISAPQWACSITQHDNFKTSPQPEVQLKSCRLVGGQTEAIASQTQSNRDTIGARALVTFESGNKIMIQNQAGEGFASQNSDKLMIGVPEGDSVVSLDVRWPSRRETQVHNPNNSKVLTIREIQE
jgi:hypothetical protein